MGVFLSCASLLYEVCRRGGARFRRPAFPQPLDILHTGLLTCPTIRSVVDMHKGRIRFGFIALVRVAYVSSGWVHLNSDLRYCEWHFCWLVSNVLMKVGCCLTSQTLQYKNTEVKQLVWTRMGVECTKRCGEGRAASGVTLLTFGGLPRAFKSSQAVARLHLLPQIDRTQSLVRCAIERQGQDLIR